MEDIRLGRKSYGLAYRVDLAVGVQTTIAGTNLNRTRLHVNLSAGPAVVFGLTGAEVSIGVGQLLVANAPSASIAIESHGEMITGNFVASAVTAPATIYVYDVGLGEQ